MAPEMDLAPFGTRVSGRRWLSPDTFEIRLERPQGFSFTPGQFIRFEAAATEGVVPERDYSLITAPTDPHLALLVRDTGTRGFSTFLGGVEIGAALEFTGPRGYFIYRETDRPAVFIATGTGLAPFVSMARSGITGFVLLHGGRTAQDLYYAPLFRGPHCRYVPCLSVAGAAEACPGAFQGRVTACLADRLAPGEYDFYLCGRREMIREATLIIDDRFPGGRVFTEAFY